MTTSGSASYAQVQANLADPSPPMSRALDVPELLSCRYAVTDGIVWLTREFGCSHGQMWGDTWSRLQFKLLAEAKREMWAARALGRVNVRVVKLRRPAPGTK